MPRKRNDHRQIALLRGGQTPGHPDVDHRAQKGLNNRAENSHLGENESERDRVSGRVAHCDIWCRSSPPSETSSSHPIPSQTNRSAAQIRTRRRQAMTAWEAVCTACLKSAGSATFKQRDSAGTAPRAPLNHLRPWGRRGDWLAAWPPVDLHQRRNGKPDIGSRRRNGERVYARKHRHSYRRRRPFHCS
jgi:hypothetical protein